MLTQIIFSMTVVCEAIGSSLVGTPPLGNSAVREYEGHANENTKVCWPTMSRVELRILNVGLGENARLRFFDAGGRKFRIQYGSCREIAPRALSRVNVGGPCYHIFSEVTNVEGTYKRVICKHNNEVVLYYKMTRTKDHITELDCAVPLIYTSGSRDRTPYPSVKEQTNSHMEVQTNSHPVAQGPMEVQTNSHPVAQGPMEVQTNSHPVAQGPMEVQTNSHPVAQSQMGVETPRHMAGQGTIGHLKHITLTSGNALATGKVTLKKDLTVRPPRVSILFESFSDMSYVELEDMFPMQIPNTKCSYFTGASQERIVAALATAETIKKIYPLRLDNIIFCCGTPPILHLGQSTVDGLGQRVSVSMHLASTSEALQGLGFEDLMEDELLDFI